MPPALAGPSWLRQPTRSGFNIYGGAIPQRGAAGGNQSLSSNKSLSFQQAYPASVQQAGEDYTGIMSGLKGVLDQPSPYAGLKQQYSGLLQRPNISPQNFTPESVVYQRSPELTESFSRLRGAAETGGYAPEELSELRARGISPIRSVYANAMRNLDRNKVLGGGYSPNYGAVSARMARDLSEQIAGQTTNVNADIAERVASGRRAMLPQFTGLAEREAGAERDVAARNVAERNRAAEANITRKTEAERFGVGREAEVMSALERIEGLDVNRKMQALEAMRSLYGTTPALAALFGQQALGAAELQERATTGSQNAGLNLIGQSMRQPSNIAQQSAPFRKTVAPSLRIGFRGRRLG